jgi:hypothetical protein
VEPVDISIHRFHLVLPFTSAQYELWEPAYRHRVAHLVYCLMWTGGESSLSALAEATVVEKFFLPTHTEKGQ